MAEPFVFSFCPGAGGRLEAMFMVDLDARCPLCRQPALQRFYHSTPFHSFTLVDFDRLADHAPLKAGFACEQCDTPVGSADIRRSALTFAFADDAGQIRRIDDLHKQTTTYLLTPEHRLDPQALPVWTPDPDDARHRLLDDLREPDIQRHFGRPFNLKLAWRDLGDRALSSTTPIVDAPSPNLLIGFGPDRKSLHQALRQRAENHFMDGDSDLHRLLKLQQQCPWTPPITGATSRGGRWPTFLSPPVIDAIDQDQLLGAAIVDISAAINAIERTLNTAHLSFERSDSPWPTFQSIQAPRGDRPPISLSTSTIAHRAVDTGLSPATAARLSAEEIVATLLDLWT